MTTAMELLYLVAFLLLTRPGVTYEHLGVKEGSDVVLPCSINDTPLNYERFDWKKDQKEVFLYDSGIHSNNGRGGQDPQFKGRVSHFEDELRNGNASIKIRNTTVKDSGDYSCIFPRLQNQIFYIELVVFVGPVKVKEGSDVVLPCSLDQKDLTNQVFDWKKDGKKEVFLHERVSTDPNKREGQHSQFKGRVSRFEDELRNGNASIKISDTKLEDSGVYSCYFPHLQNQIFHIELVVDTVLKKRNITGAAPKPYVRTLDKTADRVLLQCAVKGAFPKPRVEWKDSTGKVLHSVVTHEDEVNERFDIIFQTRVTQTGHYNCVVTQYDIGHQVYTETFVLIGASSEPYITILDETKDWSLLQCVVQGAFPKPTVEWRDSSGNIVPAKEPQVTERGGSYDIILQTTVTKTDRYRCVATQEEIKHQVYAETEVYISGSQSPGWGWLILAFVFGGVITAISVAALWISTVLRKRRPCGSAGSKVVEEAVPLSTKGPSVIRVCVEKGSVAVLLCSLWMLDLTGKVFEWKKGEQKVFLYAAGKIDNGGPLGQDQQFRGRVSHFGDELQHGNASIKIRNTKVEDGGIYTCYFPYLDPPQTFCVKLEVVDSNGRLLNSSASEV